MGICEKIHFYTREMAQCAGFQFVGDEKLYLGRIGKMFEAVYYIVASIDGDYANLQKEDSVSEEPKLVARALLPAEIMEGSILKYEMLQYEIVS